MSVLVAMVSIVRIVNAVECVYIGLLSLAFFFLPHVAVSLLAVDPVAMGKNSEMVFVLRMLGCEIAAMTVVCFYSIFDAKSG